MKLGVVFPQTEIGADPGGVREFAQAVQELGFDHLLAYDHVLGADDARHPDLVGPYRAEHLFHEILVLFGYLAGVAPRLELVTGVVIAPQRQTALLAKQAAEIDVLTGGRFRLGLGIGWNPVEYEALGENFHDRGRRFEEQIELMRRLWTEPVIDFDGRWHKITAAGINPLPVQRPIPIWIGGSAERALRRTARLADGYFPQRPLDGDWPATMQRMRQWVEEAGRDWASFGVEQRINVADGTPDDWRQTADEWRDARRHASLARDDGRRLARVPGAHVERLRAGQGRTRVIVPEDIERYAEEHTTPADPAPRRARGRDARRRCRSRRCSLDHSRGGSSSFSCTASVPSECSRSARTAAIPRWPWRLGCRRAVASTPARSTEEQAAVARRYIARSPYADRITVHLGPALETIAPAGRRLRLRLHRRRQGRLRRLLRGCAADVSRSTV